MKPTVALLLLWLLLNLTGCGGGGTQEGSAPPAPAGTQETGVPGIDEIRQAFLDAVNAARSEDRLCGNVSFHAAPPVFWDTRLAMASYLHSYDMAANGYFSHAGSDNSSAGERIAREGYSWSTYGENIAVGFPTVSAVLQAWLTSEGHCRNIMNPAFRDIGAGLAEGPYLGAPRASYWTFDLATPR